MRLAYPDNKEAISQSLEGVFCCFCFFHISRKPTLSVVLVNLIVWQARPPPHVEVTRSFLSVMSDLSGLAFSKSMHTHNKNSRATCLGRNTQVHTKAVGEAEGEASRLKQHLDPDSWLDETWCGLGRLKLCSLYGLAQLPAVFPTVLRSGRPSKPGSQRGNSDEF